MAVYVDDMRASLGRMVMCHMLADSREELDAMADRIGIPRRWIQNPGSPREHYDIALSKKMAALAAGAVQITQRQAAAMTARRRATGALGKSEDAEAWFAARAKPTR